MKLFCNIFCVFFLFSCSAPQHYTSHWHDAKANMPAAYFHQHNAISLTVSNDADFMYLEIASTAPNTIQQIKQLGLSVWLSKGATPRKTYGIHYPLPFDETQAEAALEGFSASSLVAIPLADIAPIKIQASFLPETMSYLLKIPLSELQLNSEAIFTISLSSFALGKQEYLSSLTTAEEIERRLDEYKANPEYQYASHNLAPFFVKFQLAKNPNKNP